MRTKTLVNKSKTIVDSVSMTVYPYLRWFSIVKVAGLTFLLKCTWHGATGSPSSSLSASSRLALAGECGGKEGWTWVRGGGHGGRCGVLHVAEKDVDEMFGSSEV
jgi:hypothetical protein